MPLTQPLQRMWLGNLRPWKESPRVAWVTGFLNTTQGRIFFEKVDKDHLGSDLPERVRLLVMCNETIYLSSYFLYLLESNFFCFAAVGAWLGIEAGLCKQINFGVVFSEHNMFDKLIMVCGLTKPGQGRDAQRRAHRHFIEKIVCSSSTAANMFLQETTHSLLQVKKNIKRIVWCTEGDRLL